MQEFYRMLATVRCLTLYFSYGHIYLTIEMPVVSTECLTGRLFECGFGMIVIKTMKDGESFTTKYY